MRRRAFVGLRLPAPVEQVLGGLIEQMRPLWPERGVRWVEPGNVHLTLRFLGAVEEEQLGALQRGLGEVARARAPLDLHLAACGCFPDTGRPRVVWVGVAGSGLREVQAEVEALAQALGWEAERREFRPHLTLGRVRAGARPPRRAWLPAVPMQPFCVEAVELIESRLRPGGAEYRTLRRAVLGAGDI